MQGMERETPKKAEQEDVLIVCHLARVTNAKADSRWLSWENKDFFSELIHKFYFETPTSWPFRIESTFNYNNLS